MPSLQSLNLHCPKISWKSALKTYHSRMQQYMFGFCARHKLLHALFFSVPGFLRKRQHDLTWHFDICSLLLILIVLFNILQHIPNVHLINKQKICLKYIFCKIFCFLPWYSSVSSLMTSMTGQTTLLEFLAILHIKHNSHHHHPSYSSSATTLMYALVRV